MAPHSDDAAAYLEAEPRRWPKVIGILAVCWAGIGLLFGLLWLASLAAGSGQQAPALNTVAKVAAGLGLALAAMLLAAGIQVLRRRPMGIQLLQAWIPLSLLVQVVAVGNMITDREAGERAIRESMEAQMAEQAERTGQTPPTVSDDFVKIMWAVSTGCAGLMGLVPPLVPLFFVYGRGAREVMAAWSADRAVNWPQA
jgi:hypothetical protein